MTDAEITAVGHLRAVCKLYERVAWGRALLHACRRGDRRQVDGVLELVARRCAA